jgi:hypothetical protein
LAFSLQKLSGNRRQNSGQSALIANRCGFLARGFLDKTFENLSIRGDRMRIVNHGTAGLGRFLLVVLTVVAWLSISNHCAFGSLIALETKGSVGPMHCHGDRPAPSKNRDEQTPCCKVLKAVTVAKVNVCANQIDFALSEYSTGELAVEIWQAHTHTLGLDTGPPKALSFSESVLQRSILAHAPPVSLS